MQITDGPLRVSVAPFGEAGEFEVRVPKTLGEEMRQGLEAAGFDLNPKAEFSIDPVTVVWLISASGTSVSALLWRLAPVLKEFWHRNDGKEVTFTGLPDPTTGEAVSRTYKGFDVDAIAELERLVAKEVDVDAETRRRLGL